MVNGFHSLQGRSWLLHIQVFARHPEQLIILMDGRAGRSSPPITDFVSREEGTLRHLFHDVLPEHPGHCSAFTSAAA